MYLASADIPMPSVKNFLANITVLDIEQPITTGDLLMFHSKGSKAQGKITKINEISINGKTFKRP